MTSGAAKRKSKSSVSASSYTGALYVVLGHILAAYIKFVYITTRWQWIGRDNWDHALSQPRLVAAVWHARLTPLVMARPNDERRIVAIASANKHGEYIARMLKPCRVDAVRGSSRDPRKNKDKGGSAAMAALIDEAKQGAIAVVTPDGPRGPNMRAKPGVAMVSTAAEAPIMPVGSSMRHSIFLKSWDRFMLPLPFGRGVIVIGELIQPAASDDRDGVEKTRAAVEAALLDATRRADEALQIETPAQGEPLLAPGA